MTKYRIHNEEVPRHYSPTGDAVRPTFARKTDPETGATFLVKTGERDQYALIQSCAAVTDIGSIIDRITHGDTSMLSRVKGVFGDFSEFSTDPQFNKALVDQAYGLYDSLNAEMKAQYPTFTDFLGSFADRDSFTAFYEKHLTTKSATKPEGGDSDVEK